MNHIKAKVTKIQSMDNISIVAFQAQEQVMQMMALGLNMPVEVGSEVTLGVKASSIAIATYLSGEMSISNQLKCVVEHLKYGELLCSVKLNFNNTIIESIITMNSVSKMNIKEGDTVVALIKASELSILKVHKAAQ